MNWAQRLKRVFGIDIEACARCGGKLKVIASIEEPAVIAKILAHLERSGAGSASGRTAARRAGAAGAVPSALSSKLRGRIRCRMTAGWVGLCLACGRGGEGGFPGAGRGQCGRRTVRRGSWLPDSRGGGLAMAGSGSP
jgi:hypothetical protein